MSDVLLDTYRGANNSLCSAHTVDFGGPFSNAFSGDPLLDGQGRIKCNSGVSGFCSYNGTYPADVDILVPISWLDIKTDQSFHIAGRVASNGNRYDLLFDATGPTLALYCYVGGSPTQIGSSVAFTRTVGQVYNFILECHGTTITAYKDGVSIISGTNSQISAAGWVAILLSGANTDTTGIRFGKLRAYPFGAPSATLAIATPTLTSRTSTTANVAVTAATGGIPTYTYQWYRSTSSGFTPGSGNIVSGATSITLNDTGLTPGADYYYKVIATDAGSQTVTSAELHVDSPTLASGSVPVTGEKISLTISSSVTGLLLSDFSAIADGVALPLASLTGSGTSYALVLGAAFIGLSQVIHVTYSGSVVPGTTITPTNNSTVPMVIVNYNKKQFGAFITFSAATFPAAVDPVLQSAANVWFTPNSYSMDNILNAAQTMGAKYCVFTAKHGGAFCLWPTASGAPNIGPTPWYIANGIDMVADFVTKARARGLGIGLYINFYDSWFTSTRSGHNGTYTNTAPTFTAYISQQITELLSNYGPIDYLWTDSWGYTVGYTACPYAPIRSLVTSLQPNCILINNDHAAVVNKLLHSDIAEYEDNEGLSPDATTIVASEFCEPSRSDDTWVWVAAGEAYIAPSAAVTSLNTLVGFHSNFLLNITPNDQGVIPPLQAAFTSALGALLGITPVPPPTPPTPPLAPAGVNYNIWLIAAAAGYGGASPSANLSVGKCLQSSAEYLESISYLPHAAQLSAIAAIEAILFTTYNAGGPGAGAPIQTIVYNLWLAVNPYYAGPPPLSGESLSGLLTCTASILNCVSYLPSAKQAAAITAIDAYLMAIYA